MLRSRLLSCVGAAALAVAAGAPPADATMLERLRGSLFGFGDPLECAEAFYRGRESQLAANGIVWACTMTMSEAATEDRKQIARCYFAQLPGTRSDEAAEQKMQACGG